MQDLIEYLNGEQQRFRAELMDFLRIPSVSSLPEHTKDVASASSWVARRLETAGIEGIEILETGGHPVVTGGWHGAPGNLTVLIYGHFDVQPVDPIEEWSHPPFQPVLEDGRIYARGASDDKGNMLIPILAVEALFAVHQRLPLNVKFFFEGQEEIGSPQLPSFLARERERFACDLVISADGGQWGEDQPSLLVATKGLAASELHVRGPNQDLHSGLYGGAVQNPLHGLVQMLDSLHDGNGRILVEGFYDDVVELSEEDRRLMAAVPQDDEEIRRHLGVEALFGEVGYTTLERQWGRPTLELNGISGGFQGEGTKTVIPRSASAKITCRLVADQDPQRINGLIAEHLRRHTPPGVEAELVASESMAHPYRIPPDHWSSEVATSVLRQVYDREPYTIRTGGSIPVCSLFKKELGAETLIFAFALPDERFHAPDEFFRLASFEKGQRAWCLLLDELARA